MKKLLTMIVAASAAVGANADTIDINGITWTYTAKDTANRTVTLGDGTNPCIAKTTTLDAADIPWTMYIDGEQYRVTKIASSAFDACSKLTGTLTIPSFVTAMEKQVFKGAGITRIASFGGITSFGDSYCFQDSKLASADFYNSRLVNASFYCAKSLAGTALMPKTFAIATVAHAFRLTAVDGIVCPGPDTVASGTQTYTTLSMNNFAQGATSCKLIFFGPNTKSGNKTWHTDGNMLKGVSGCTVFAPANGYWDGLVTGGSDNEVVYYGANQPLDMAIDADTGVAVATPTTAATLVSVLKTAPYFGLNVRVNVTNTIEVAAGAITADMLNAVKFNTMLLTFKVNTQEQLDSVFAAVPASDYPLLAIDASDAKSKLIVPDGREVFVRLKSGEGRQGEYTPHINGLVISFH